MNMKPHPNTNSRAAQRLGDFGEGLVTYALIRQHFEVARVDDIGADLIAEGAGHRIAVSVKTRLYREESKESRGFAITDEHIEKLNNFAGRYQLEPVFAHVACDANEKSRTMHLFIMRVVDISKLGLAEENGRRYLNYSAAHLKNITASKFIDYSRWSDESIGTRLAGILSSLAI